MLSFVFLTATDTTATSEYTQQVYQGSKWVHCIEADQIISSFIVFECYARMRSWNVTYTAGSSVQPFDSSEIQKTTLCNFNFLQVIPIPAGINVSVNS